MSPTPEHMSEAKNRAEWAENKVGRNRAGPPREFPFWKRKIPPPRQRKIPEYARSVKCLMLHML